MRQRLRVTGVVQGVGFRPFVYSLAQARGLGGWVGNDSAGVLIEVEGPAAALAAFQTDLVERRPPLARIEAVTVEDRPALGEAAFRIVESQAQPAARTLIAPDLCLCADCRRELFDPANRRYRYPFINCTNCGPRFTIVRDIPYDRPLTTMAAFAMCPDCLAEYQDPGDRRFHAQPNACPVCGPRVWLEAGSSAGLPGPAPIVGEAALQAARQLLAAGHIVAVKGLGGFHLACDGLSDFALQNLRARKGRVDKPFAVMAPDLAAARALAEVNAAEADLLTSRERPIVLLRRRPAAPLSPLVAPGNPDIGVMLPYTPLHELLLAGRGPLVLTSGNYSAETITKDNAEARERLAGLADAFLMHDREIQAWADDSVVRVFEGHELPLRRSRGYAPFPVRLPFEAPPTLAVGGELKATFCLAEGAHAFLSQHLGDLENLETLHAFERAVAHFQRLFRCAPEVLAADRHPRYLSSRWARERAAQLGGPRLVEVQHHHAHIAAALAEAGRPAGQPVIGFSFDGTGYGLDGAIWGGEVMVADYAGFERAYHLAYVPLAGGDAAVQRPYRVALAHLRAAGVAWDEALPCVAACPPAERGVLARQLAAGLNAVPTSSFGRLFDAAAAVLGGRQTVTYEAQAAIELEARVDPAVSDAYAFEIGADTFDAAPVFRALAADVLAGAPIGTAAARLHHAVADLIVELSRRLRRAHGLRTVALSGGVFQNVTLLAGALARLRAAGFEVLIQRQTPPNDGGLALGQAAIAAHQR